MTSQSSIPTARGALGRRGPTDLSSAAEKTIVPLQKKSRDSGRGERRLRGPIRLASMRVTVPNTTLPEPAPLTGSTLIAAIARLQQWHGGFLLTTTLLHLLGDSLGLSQSLMSFDGFQQALKNHGFDADRECNVGATLLALVWMERYGGEEVLDLREKTSEWLNEEVGQDRARVLKEEIICMLGSAVPHH